MHKLKVILTTYLILSSVLISAQRQQFILNNDWMFRLSHVVEKNSAYKVDLPHTWNQIDALQGKLDYKRGVGNYEKTIFIDQELKGKRLFLKFDGANNITNLLINKKFVGEHRGGYSSFIFEITDKVLYGENNSILVRVNNAEQLDVMPLVGDFNMYGGIYRDVSLLITDDVCISPTNYAASGLQLIQDSVCHSFANIRARIDISNASASEQNLELRIDVKDQNKGIIHKNKNIIIKPYTNELVEFDFSINNPHLWNGVEDPFMYNVSAEIWRNDKLIDSISQPLGLRFYSIDSQNGFFLNGKHLSLKGVCCHQDRSEVGNAINKKHQEEDLRLMKEMGVNAVRLAHYPHSSYFYDLMDKAGIIVWAEIPFIGPGGYEDKGFIDSPSFRSNGKEQLKELIRQNYNHPSICMWGLFNELNESGDNPIEYINELNELAHIEDPTRPTTSASNQDGNINYITDLIAWNKYNGWYGGTPKDLGHWLDNMHNSKPELKIGISEYGAGASIYHQQDSLIKPKPVSWWHPENWQTYYHIENWKVISSRPFVWGSFVWNMFDFGAAHRTEGDRPGINDKGLVTFDRKTNKDAYYFYKANWNEEPMIHLAGKRHHQRNHQIQSFMAFTNQANAELFVNGISMGKHKTDSHSIVEWKNIQLNEGVNEIKVIAKKGKIKLIDSFECIIAK